MGRLNKVLADIVSALLLNFQIELLMGFLAHFSLLNLVRCARCTLVFSPWLFALPGGRRLASSNAAER